MEQNVELNVIDIDGKKYFLFESIIDNQNKYHFFVQVDNVKEIKVLKDSIEDGETYFVSLDDDVEEDYALRLFYEKHKDDEALNH